MLTFAKYHGLGNDFVILDRRSGGRDLDAREVRAICDRHRGVGADGVLSLRAHPTASALMVTQNSDGSEAGVCGNGLRCASRFLYDSGIVAPSVSELTLAAGERIYRVERLAADCYRIGMGRAEVSHPDLPRGGASGEPVTLTVDERSFAASCCSLGNPHAVIFLNSGGSDSESPLELAQRYGPALERHPGFPNRVNVSFARLRGSDGFDVVVYERGAGITQACGSGACAVAAAAVRRGLRSVDHPIEVYLPGGALRIVVRADGLIEMQGEAIRVFTGVVEGIPDSIERPCSSTSTPVHSGESGAVGDGSGAAS